MQTRFFLWAALATAFAAGAHAADTGHAGARTSERAAAMEGFGRLSDDGVSAFNDIHLARMEIFDGDTDRAAKLVSDALASLQRAKSQNEAVTKSETDLQGPSPVGSRGRGRGSEPPIAWLPIDAEIVIGQTYKSSAENAAAIVDANKSLDHGEGDKALERLRMAAIDADYVLALAPLDQSISDVEEASRLIAARDFYGASQALRRAEENVRYDEVDDVAHVRRQASKTADGGK